MKKDLNTRFEEAYKFASNTNKKLPPDVMLQFYAYYKQATMGTDYKKSESNEEALRSSFKLHAWFQLKHLTQEEAKEGYIKLVKKHLK